MTCNAEVINNQFKKKLCSHTLNISVRYSWFDERNLKVPPIAELVFKVAKYKITSEAYEQQKMTYIDETHCWIFVSSAIEVVICIKVKIEVATEVFSKNLSRVLYK